MRIRELKLPRLVLAAAFLLAPLTAVAQDATPRVLVAALEGVITPVSADHAADTIERAERDGHDAVLLTMDTPGGLDTSMREIVRSILGSRVPVIVWVAPPGARAASAGAVITLSAHVAAMAPGTNIGAATPVDMEGGDLGDKIINDATAYVTAIAAERGRDLDFARDIVQEGRSEAADDALEIGAIDIVEADRDRLMERIDGETVQVGGEEHELRTASATFAEQELGFINGVRQRLADPNLAFLFMSLGTLAIIYEIANPGMGLGGIAGVILLVLAFFALSVLPVSTVGIVLLLLAAGLFVAELFVPGIGVMAAGGTVALVLAGLFLVEGDQQVAWSVLLPTALVIFGAVVFAGRMVWRARRNPVMTGATGIVGKTAEVRRSGDRGVSQIFLDGAWWSVQSSDGRALEVGEQVIVREMDGLRLVVDPVTIETEEADR